VSAWGQFFKLKCFFLYFVCKLSLC
jgi:hypothetical protein